MSALDVLAELHEAGIRISATDGQLRLRARHGEIDPALQEKVRAHKTELISLLSGYTSPVSVYPTRGKDYDAPLSFAQEKLVFLNAYVPGDTSYNMAFRCELSGPLEIDILKQSIEQLVDKHPALRTSFHQTNAGFLQRIHASAPAIVECIDARKLDVTEQTRRAEELACKPFDLTTAPLLRLHLLQQSDEHHTLLLVAHHIVFDMHSAALCCAQLQSIYADLLAGSLRSEDEPLNYADFADWQRKQQRKGRLDNLLEYWLRELADAPDALELPGDRPRPPEPSGAGGWAACRLQPEVTASLATLAVQHSATPSMVLFAAFQVFLARISGEKDMVIGLPVDGRGYTELENVVGFFLNTLAIRCKLASDMRFIDVVTTSRNRLIDAYKHQDLAFERLVEELQPDRDMSRTPVFQVMFAWHDNTLDHTDPSASVQFSGPEIVGQNTAKFDLTLSIFRRGDEIEFGFEYNSDIFTSQTAERLLGNFRLLLQDALRNPDNLIGELQILDSNERRKILHDFNATDDEVAPACLHQLVEQQAERTPDAIALEDGNEHWTYRELSERADCLAQYLLTNQAGAGQRVGILTERGANFPLAMLAILKAGAAYVPLDTTLPRERLRYLMDDADIRLLLTESGLEKHTNKDFLLLDQFDFGSAENTGNKTVVRPEDPAYVIYTSGSTGKPKGTVLSHAGLANLLHWQAQQPGLDHPARTLHYASLCFDVTFTETFSTWAGGGTLICIDDTTRRDFHQLLNFLEKRDVERLFLPCAALHPFAETLNSLPADTRVSFSEIIVSGEQLNISNAIRTMFTRFAQLRLHNHYGPAETHVVTACTLPADASAWEAAVSIGKPISNTQIYILDERDQPTPVGVPGQLCIGGSAVGLGYYERTELTAQKFIPDPYSEKPAAQMYKTGDLARFRPDGSIEFLGRMDQQMKIRGYRVEPGEIEVALDQFDEIRRAVVAVRKSASTSADAQLVAWIETTTGDTPDEQLLRKKLAESLPEYMVPDIFATVGNMPMTASGKIDRLKLPDPDLSAKQTDYRPPVTTTEKFLCECFSDLLQVERTGLHDNFFHLGGQSLMAMRLVAKIREQLGFAIPLKYVFRYPTPEQLAATLGTLDSARHVQQDDKFEREQHRV